MKIAIIGNSGSGKSRLAQTIAHERRWPVLDPDTVTWEPQKIAVPRADPDPNDYYRRQIARRSRLPT